MRLGISFHLSLLVLLYSIQSPIAQGHQCLRISRVENTFNAPFLFSLPRPPLKGSLFERWKKHFATPNICTMVLCRGTCANYSDGCPPFLGLVVLDPDRPGYLITDRLCSGDCVQQDCHSLGK